MEYQLKKKIEMVCTYDQKASEHMQNAWAYGSMYCAVHNIQYV